MHFTIALNFMEDCYCFSSNVSSHILFFKNLLSHTELMGLQVWSGLHVIVPLPFTWWPFGHVTLTDWPTWNILWEMFLLLFSLQPGGGGQGKAAQDKKSSLLHCITILTIFSPRLNTDILLWQEVKSCQFCVQMSVSSASRWQVGKVELQVFPPIQTASWSPARRNPLLHWNWTAWPVFRLSSCTLPFCISLGLWQPLAAGGREHIVHRWKTVAVLVNGGANQPALHTFASWCRVAPGAVGLTEESLGAQQLQPGGTHVRGILWEWLPLGLHMCIVHWRRRPTRLRCRDSQQALMMLYFKHTTDGKFNTNWLLLL